MKKKNYEQPKIKVVMLKQTGIICTSDPEATTEQLLEEDYNW